MTDAPPEPPPIPLSAPQETQVEIHKVKPIHTWRDFLKELGTIVLGIIIAISLEHLVQSWNWDHEVKIARQALFTEISNNNINAFSFRVAATPCVDRKISQVETVLSALEAGRKTGGLSNFLPVTSITVRDSEWQSERASQVLTHFPRTELALFSHYYSMLDEFSNRTNKETDAWDQLQILQNPVPGLTVSDLARLRTHLEIAKRAAYLMDLNSQRLLRISTQLGVPDLPPDAIRVKNFCTMNVDEFRRYRRSQDLR